MFVMELEPAVQPDDNPAVMQVSKYMLVPEGGAVMFPWNQTSQPILKLWLP